jgi:tRNA nucleotidyltransferase (CCA-adding enzyme)
MFPSTVTVDELRRIGLAIGYKVIPDGEERYAEHPYISGKFQKIDTDIVPCYKIDDIKNKMTAVDRTPFHTEYVKEHLMDDQFNEVRLLKQFMKGVDVYGAEISVLGFSGYLCELLILKFGTFASLLKNATTWPNELVMRLDDSDLKQKNEFTHNDRKKLLSQQLIRKFENEPMVFIDPVDESRNVASALSSENIELFKLAATKYLKAPNRLFFFPNQIKPLDADELNNMLVENHKTIIGLSFATPDVVPDILHGQLRKAQRSIQKLLNNAGFGVEFCRYYMNDRTLILYQLNKAVLPDTQSHYGPPKDHANEHDFLSKWQNESIAVSKPYVKDNRWFVDIKREFTSPVELLKNKLTSLNLGKHVMTAVEENVMIYQDHDLVSNNFDDQLTHFLLRKHPWEI